MSKFIDADRLRAEIEKHIKDVKDAGKRIIPNFGFFDAKLSGIYDVMSIIDTIESEPVPSDLEEAVEKPRRGGRAGEHRAAPGQDI